MKEELRFIKSQTFLRNSIQIIDFDDVIKKLNSTHFMEKMWKLRWCIVKKSWWRAIKNSGNVFFLCCFFTMNYMLSIQCVFIFLQQWKPLGMLRLLFNHFSISIHTYSTIWSLKCGKWHFFSSLTFHFFIPFSKCFDFQIIPSGVVWINFIFYFRFLTFITFASIKKQRTFFSQSSIVNRNLIQHRLLLSSALFYSLMMMMVSFVNVSFWKCP